MRAVLRYGVIISYAHPGAVATIGTLNMDNYSSQSHSCPQDAATAKLLTNFDFAGKWMRKQDVSR